MTLSTLLTNTRVALLLLIVLLTSLCSSPHAQNHSRLRFDGIDISHHNADVNFAKFPKNIKFIIYIKATQGRTYTGPKYKSFVKQAKKEVFLVGSYHYFRMTSSAHAQFKHLSEIIIKSDQDLVPMIDVETSD